MRCVDPAIRAVSLLHARGESARGDAMITAGGLGQACAASTLVPEGLLLLLSPGPVAAALRRDSVPCRGSFDALQRTASPPNATASPAAASASPSPLHVARVHGTLALSGRLRGIPAPERKGAALAIAAHHPVEQLLDALTHRGGWVLAVLELTSAAWQLPCGVFALDLEGLLRAEADPLLQESLEVCSHLNDSHRAVATSLASQSAYFAEIDTDGATLGLTDRDGFLRVAWPHPCLDICDVLHLLHEVSAGRLGV